MLNERLENFMAALALIILTSNYYALSKQNKIKKKSKCRSTLAKKRKEKHWYDSNETGE